MDQEDLRFAAAGIGTGSWKELRQDAEFEYQPSKYHGVLTTKIPTPSANILPQILHSPSINSWHLLLQNHYSVLFTKKFKSLAAHKDQNQMLWFTSSSQSQRKCEKKNTNTWNN